MISTHGFRDIVEARPPHMAAACGMTGIFVPGP